MRKSFEPPRRRGGAVRAALIASGVAILQAGLLILAGWRVAAPVTPPAAPLEVWLIAPAPVREPPAEPSPQPGAAASAGPASEPVSERVATAPPRPSPRPVERPPPPETPVLTVAPGPPGPPDLPVIGGARLAGALRAGGRGGRGFGPGAGGTAGGDGGGACDMVARLERALAADEDIRSAVAASLASRGGAADAVLVWNGDWLQSPGQAGKGLAGVRQAIAVEIAFAPGPCREEVVQGFVVLAAGRGPDAPHLALGPGTWRWRDLLGL